MKNWWKLKRQTALSMGKYQWPKHNWLYSFAAEGGKVHMDQSHGELEKNFNCPGLISTLNFSYVPALKFLEILSSGSCLLNSLVCLLNMFSKTFLC